MQKIIVDTFAIDVLLVGNEKEIAEAIKLIDFHFRGHIIGIIRKTALSADLEELRGIYHDVIVSIMECAKSQKYNPDAEKLLSFIYTIAYRRAADWVRKKTGVLETSNTDEIVDAVNQVITESKYGSSWEMMRLENKRELFLLTIQKLIPNLKQRQRQIAEIIKDDFPKHLENADIKEQILKRYGDDVTIISVRRAKQEVLNKIKDALSESGYGDDINE